MKLHRSTKSSLWFLFLAIIGISFFNYQQTTALKDRSTREELVKQREAEIMFMKDQYMKQYANQKESTAKIQEIKE